MKLIDFCSLVLLGDVMWHPLTLSMVSQQRKWIYMHNVMNFVRDLVNVHSNRKFQSCNVMHFICAYYLIMSKKFQKKKRFSFLFSKLDRDGTQERKSLQMPCQMYFDQHQQLWQEDPGKKCIEERSKWWADFPREEILI